MAGFFRQIVLEYLGDGETIAALGCDASSAGDPNAFFCGTIRGNAVERPASLRLDGARALAASARAMVVAIGSDAGEIRVCDVAADEVVFSGKVPNVVLSLALDDAGETIGVVHRKGEGSVLATIDVASKKRHELVHGALAAVCHARGAFWTTIKNGRKYELVAFAKTKRGAAFGLGGSAYGLARALHADVIAAGVGKKSVVVVDLDAGAVKRVSAHDQKDPYAAVSVAVSHDGTVVVSRGSHDAKLAVTSDGKATAIAKLDDVDEPYGTGDRLITTPGFVTNGRVITTFDGTNVGRLSLV